MTKLPCFEIALHPIQLAVLNLESETEDLLACRVPVLVGPEQPDELREPWQPET